MVSVTLTLLTISLFLSFPFQAEAVQKKIGSSADNNLLLAEEHHPGKSPSSQPFDSGEGSIIKMPTAETKSKMPSFVGSWYFKDVLRGEELIIEAFEISKNASGDLVLMPPKRAADSYASVIQFEISDRNLKVQLRWKMKSVVGYWKTETYDLVLSADGKTLTGTHNQKSMGGRTIEMDRVLFRH